VKLMWWG